VNGQLLADLEAFERDALSREDLRFRQGSEVDGVLVVHDRIRALASSAQLDVEAGWALVVARLAEPAPVIPLRPRSRPRIVGLVAAAALMLAASAFAAAGSHGVGERPAILPVVPATDIGLTPSGSPRAGGHPPTGFVHDSSDDDPVTTSEPGTTDAGGSEGQGGQDSPDDTDHGSGNDGGHDDEGGGNDSGGGQQTGSAAHSDR
jgi:hypothetical protein